MASEVSTYILHLRLNVQSNYRESKKRKKEDVQGLSVLPRAVHHLHSRVVISRSRAEPAAIITRRRYGLGLPDKVTILFLWEIRRTKMPRPSAAVGADQGFSTLSPIMVLFKRRRRASHAAVRFRGTVLCF